MKSKKNVSYVLILVLLVVSGLVFANREIKHSTKPSPKPLPDTDRKDRAEPVTKWEFTADGVKYKLWEASPAGKKVYASHHKIRDDIKAFSRMDALITSVTFRSQP